MPNNIINSVVFQGDDEKVEKLLSEIQYLKYGLGSIDFNKIIPMPDNIYSGDLGPEERQKYGENNWYDWRISNWNTKWESYGYDVGNNFDGDNTIRFETAWTAPHPILQKLSEMYPEIEITHRWADEDFGMNCGERGYRNGEITGEYIPNGGSIEAYDFSADVLECDVADYGLRMNADGSAYINITDEEYELIEIFGKPALFTSLRMSTSDIPSGLYKCDVRGDDETTGGFAELSPSVLINHFGTIITDEPIDFGKDGYIILTEETEPNFLGNSITMEQYMQGNFEHQEIQGGINFE